MIQLTPETPVRDRQLALAEALESGEFKQGRVRLRVVINPLDPPSDSFCCLGIACELFRRTFPEKTFWRDPVPGHRSAPSYRAIQVGQQTNYGYLPDEVMEWFGFATDRASFNDEARLSGTNSLTTLNDDGKSFAEIAAIIREAPKGLFREQA